MITQTESSPRLNAGSSTQARQTTRCSSPAVQWSAAASERREHRQHRSRERAPAARAARLHPRRTQGVLQLVRVHRPGPVRVDLLEECLERCGTAPFSRRGRSVCALMAACSSFLRGGGSRGEESWG